MNLSINDSAAKSLKRGRIAACLCLAASVVALAAAAFSFLFPGIYQTAIAKGVMAQGLLPGSAAQDGVTIPAALLAIVLAVLYLKRPSLKVQIALMGIAGNYLYGYGLYAMEGNFTSLYPMYLAVFSLSIFCLVFGLAGLSGETAARIGLGAGLRRAIAIFLLFIVVLFVCLWSAMVAGNTVNHTRPDTYGVFVLDLCFVMPSLAIIAVLLLGNRGFGIALAGVALVKAFTLILSVAIAESIGPNYGLAPNLPMIAVYSVIVLISLTLGIFYFIRLKPGDISATEGAGR